MRSNKKDNGHGFLDGLHSPSMRVLLAGFEYKLYCIGASQAEF